MNASQKDVIYIDVDDEITSIIDKLRASNQKIVALVLPKRASMLQSSVNMKLLKKAAADDKKNLVLVTSEAGLMPLAASVGMLVAKTPQSKPEIPKVEDLSSDTALADLTVEDEADKSDFDNEAAATTPIGELAGVAGAAEEAGAVKAKPELTPRPIPYAKPEDEAIELDNTVPDEAAGAATDTTAKSKKTKNKKLHVPNFESFRLKLVLAAVLLLILIIGFIIANTVLPKASITIATNTSNVNASLALNLSPAAKAVDPATLTLPANLQQTQKSNSQQVNTTGQKNTGTTAAGTVTMTAGSCSANVPSSVPAGTGLSSNGLTFITGNDASFTATISHGKCIWQGINNKNGTDISITAQSGGSQYNTPNGTSFSVASRADVSATGTTFGGTDNNISVVTQADINNASQKITAQDTSAIKTALAASLTAAGYYPLPVTFNAGTPNTTSSVNVGEQASSVTVTQTTTYTMFGVKQAELQALLNSAIDQQINTHKQAIQEDGFNKATFTLTSQASSGAQVSMQSAAVVGPHLDATSVKAQIAGKKTGDIRNIIGTNPGVTKVTVKYSPFWVSSAPKNVKRITVVFTKS